MCIIDTLYRVMTSHGTFITEAFISSGGPPPTPVTEELLAVATGALADELAFA